MKYYFKDFCDEGFKEVTLEELNKQINEVKDIWGCGITIVKATQNEMYFEYVEYV
jgi:hypothetical protein